MRDTSRPVASFMFCGPTGEFVSVAFCGLDFSS
jgi:hypothetical protein